MSLFLLLIAAGILSSVFVGLIRVVRGPTAADRMLSAQLVGTSGVAVVLLLAQALQMPLLRDVALVFAILAAVATVAFVRRAWFTLESDGPAEQGAGR